MQCSVVQCSLVQCSVVQCSAGQLSVVHSVACSTEQCSGMVGEALFPPPFPHWDQQTGKKQGTHTTLGGGGYFTLGNWSIQDKEHVTTNF